MAKTIVGLFDNYEDAQSAVNDLLSSGFKHDDISLVASNATKTFVQNEGGTVEHSSVAGGVVKGGVEGAVLGGLTGFAASVALFLIPGIGPVVGAGALAATLGGAGLGAVGGAAIGGLSRLGIPDTEAGYYAEGIRRGGTLVTVRAEDNMADKAVSIIDSHNPVNIDERADYYKSTGYAGYDEKAPAYTPDQIMAERETYANNYATASMPSMAATTATATTPMSSTVNAGETMTVPIVEEQLQVGKRQVQGGGARVHTHVVETPVEEQVTLRQENVTVERNTVNRAATDADMANAFKEGTIELTEKSEEAVVSKQARVVGEVVIGKEATERTETITDTVRRTDVDVEDLTTSTTTTATMPRNS